jgi:O-antigen/teichoic acid export membrane protein
MTVDATDAGTRTARSLLLLRLGTLVVVFVGSVALARLLGPELRGIQAFVTTACVLLAALFGLGVPTGGYVLATSRGADIGRLEASAPWISLAAGLVATAALLVVDAASAIAPAGIDHIVMWPAVFAIGVSGFILSNFQVLFAYAGGRAIAGTLLSIGPFFISAVGYLVLGAFSAPSVTATAYLFAFSPVITATLAWATQTAARPGRGSVPLLNQSLRNGLRNYPSEVGALLHQRLDVVFLGVLASSTAAGLYVVAYQTVEPILILSSTGAAIVLSRGLDPSTRTPTVDVAATVREVLVVGAVLAGVAAAVAPFVVPLVYGTDFELSVLPMQLLAPGIVGLAVARVAMAGLVRMDALGAAATIAIVALVANVGANLVLIPSLGAIGASVASLASYTVLALLSMLAVSRSGSATLGEFVPRRADLGRIVRAWRPRRDSPQP